MKYKANRERDTQSKRIHSKANNDKKSEEEEEENEWRCSRHKMTINYISIESQLKIEWTHDKIKMEIEKRHKTQKKKRRKNARWKHTHKKKCAAMKIIQDWNIRILFTVCFLFLSIYLSCSWFGSFLNKSFAALFSSSHSIHICSSFFRSSFFFK